ncbi:MAG: transposase family protein [Oscillospiraceae bacterium]|jgi:transposase|nr:transposase family protein [Oscillospiraceae bacterium]
MDELVKLLDENLAYEHHEIIDDILYIYVASARQEAVCPYCGSTSDKTHSRYERRFRDLPIQGKKTEVVLFNRKMFCPNERCGHKTFAETFDCLPHKAKRSTRLTEEIVKVSLEVSSVKASALLKRRVAKVGKSTICNLLKKRRAATG